MDTLELGVDIFDPDRWGLPADAVAGLADRLHVLWTRFRPCFTTTTRDGSLHAWTYLRGVLTMPTKRTFANIACCIIGPTDDGQALQQFMSDSPWSAQRVIHQVQSDLAATPALQRGGRLILGESADAKAGLHSAGAARQWNGRLGKLDLCQVGVFLAFATETLWTWIDGELFLPEPWFAPEVTTERTRLGIPLARSFATGVSAAAGGGRASSARTQGTTSNAASGAQWCHAGEVRQVTGRADTHFRRVQVRATERGVLEDAFAVRQVWTIHDDEVVAEWLVIRDEGGQPTYALSNAPPTTPEARLVEWKCRRFGVECANHDAKAELGWGDFQAQKYTAWEHHLALTILAGWFVAQTKTDWQRSMGGMAGWQRRWACTACRRCRWRMCASCCKP